MNPKEVIARRVAREVKPDTLVNLGIGLPSMVANYLPDGVHVFFQAENGVIGLGARPPEGMEDPDLTDAGGGFVTAVPGAASIDSAMSFGLIRGGHLDMTVLGGLQVDERGYLANWTVPGKMVSGTWSGTVSVAAVAARMSSTLTPGALSRRTRPASVGSITASSVTIRRTRRLRRRARRVPFCARRGSLPRARRR
ncbi:MAG: CoA-transferase, partial [Pseudomonadota bacterium]